MPADKTARHLMTPALVSRELSVLHPKEGLPCLHCGTTHTGAHGPTCLSGYTFTAAEIATALIAVGNGESYGEVSADIRRGAMRKRQPSRRAAAQRRKKLRPRKPLPVRTPRNLLDKKAAAKKRPNGPLPRKNYGYGKAKPIENARVAPSRSGNLAQAYVDVFAPVIFAAFPVTEWPEVVIIDSLPIKRRRIAINKKGKIANISAGESQGEIYAAADGTTTPGTPILAGLEGSKDHTSVKRFLSRLATNEQKPPVWVVADIDEGIRVAVEDTWPGAVLYRCEEHLKILARKALAADGIGPWVPLGDANAANPKAKGVLFEDEFIEHRLYYMLHSAMWTPTRWRTFVKAVDRIADPDKDNARVWLAKHTDLVLSQVTLRKQHPGYPRSTGAIEGTIRRIKKVVSERAEYYRNGVRLDKLINLVRLDACGLADADTYANLITKHLIAREGAGLDWHSGRDLFGTGSIDDRIEVARNEHAPVAVNRRMSVQRARIDARTVEVNAWLAAKGLPPIGRARQPQALDPIYQIPRAGRTVADYPELVLQYDPARNGGVPASARPAGSGLGAVWVCTDHPAPTPAHEHVFPAPVERRTSGSRCPFCTGKEICEYSTLRYRRPDLTLEWHPRLNGKVTPDDVTPGMPRIAFWKCLKNRKHKPFPQEIAARDSSHAGCQACVDEERAARSRKTVNAKSQDQRSRAAQQRPLKVPPVLDATTLALPFVVGEATVTPDFAGRALSRSDQTIRNWIRDGRLRAHALAGSRVRFMIPQTEVDRLVAILGKPPGAKSKAA